MEQEVGNDSVGPLENETLPGLNVQLMLDAPVSKSDRNKIKFEKEY